MQEDSIEKRVENLERFLGLSLATKEPTGELQRVVLGGVPPTRPRREMPSLDELIQRIEDMINDALNRSTNTDSEIIQIINQWFIDNKSYITNIINPPPDETTQTTTIFEVVSAATGDGIYNCRSKYIDEDLWSSEAGVDKMINYGTTAEVLNLHESAVQADYARGLVKYDLLSAFEVPDDEEGTKWVGIPLVPSPRLAVTTASADWGKTIACNLITRLGSPAASGELGYNITVNANICNAGTALNAAANRLFSGDYIYVVNIRGKWYIAETFNKSKDCS